MLKPDFLLRIMTSNTNQTNLSERNVFLDIQVDLITKVEDKNDTKDNLKELLDLVDRYKRRYQPNIEMPQDLNLMKNAEPKAVMVGATLDRKLKNQLGTLLNKYIDVSTCSYTVMSGLDTDHPGSPFTLATRMQACQIESEAYETRAKYENKGTCY